MILFAYAYISKAINSLLNHSRKHFCINVFVDWLCSEFTETSPFAEMVCGISEPRNLKINSPSWNKILDIAGVQESVSFDLVLFVNCNNLHTCLNLYYQIEWHLMKTTQMTFNQTLKIKRNQKD